MGTGFETVKTFRVIALLGAFTGAIAFGAKYTTIYAASPAPDAASAPGASIYQQNCAVCHGEKLEGIPPSFPSLAGVGHRMDAKQLTDLVHHGRGRMPAFTETKLPARDLNSLLAYLALNSTFTTPVVASAQTGSGAANDPGGNLYQQNCTFCHGKDLAGGESGPDLTRSKLVAADVNGDQISPIVRNGRAEGKMPKFNFGEVEMADLVKYIHTQVKLAASRPGGRRGVDVSDLQTGNVEAGRQYFEGAGGCSKCHSSTGDLAGVALRYQGLQLEERMLYPRGTKDKITVTLASGQTLKGTVEYQDEFVIGMRDSAGVYHSWPVTGVKFSIDSPVQAHVDQFPKYTDDDIHNLMAYIQTLKEAPDVSKTAKKAADSSDEDE
jgi:mono/diheme cytochrome c family protein